MNFAFLDVMMRSRSFLFHAEVRRIPSKFFGLLLYQTTETRANISKVSSFARCGSSASYNRFPADAWKDSPKVPSVRIHPVRGCQVRLFASDTSVNSTTSSSKIARLGSRSLLLISGKDSAVFLQGLITNDIHLLDASDEGGPTSIYAMLLNTQGRVMYDVIIYKFAVDTFLIEHDTALQPHLIRHLKMYKLRKVVELDSDVKFDVYACFGSESDDNTPQIATDTIRFPDPRLSLLGTRLYVRSANKNWKQGMEDCETTDEGQYRKFRYMNGIAEGKTDLPPGECFPLESNLDYLSGVHFHKGCYLGQELTARTQHTGVVRKRIMPVSISGNGLDDGQSDVLPAGSGISTEHGEKTVSVGKLRAHVGTNGLAVLRISEALAAPTLDLALDGKVYEVRATKPEWWPDPD